MPTLHDTVIEPHQKPFLDWLHERIVEDVLSHPLAIIVLFVLLAAIKEDAWYLVYAGQVAVLTGLATLLSEWIEFLKERRRRRRRRKGRSGMKLELTCLALGILFPPALPFVAQIYVFSWLAKNVFGWLLDSTAETAERLLAEQQQRHQREKER